MTPEEIGIFEEYGDYTARELMMELAKADAVFTRFRDFLCALDEELSAEPDTQRAAMMYEVGLRMETIMKGVSE